MTMADGRGERAVRREGNHTTTRLVREIHEPNRYFKNREKFDTRSRAC